MRENHTTSESAGPVLRRMEPAGRTVAGTSVESNAGRAGSASATGERYDGIVVFRNDDLKPNYYTEEMRKINQIFIEAGVPVTLGVIPTLVFDGKPTVHDPEGEFCTYVRDMKSKHPGVFELAMHGYTHDPIANFRGTKTEFGGLSLEVQKQRIKEGKAAFEETMKRTPKTFIPPYNNYDRNTVTAAKEHGFDVISGGDLSEPSFGQSGVFETQGVRHIMIDIGMKKLNGLHTNDFLLGLFDEARRNGEVYVQMLHHHNFTEQSNRNQLRRLIQEMLRTNTYFTSLGALDYGLRTGQIRRSGTDWIVEQFDGGEGDGGGDGDGGGGGNGGGGGSGEPFADISGHPFEDAIRSLIDQGVISGYLDDTFRPEQTLTRAEFASMIAEAFDPDPEKRPTFGDLDGHWSQEQVRTAAGAGFVSGYPDGTFRPEREVTKVESLVALNSGLGYSGGDPGVLSSAYADAGKIPEWARQAVANVHATWGSIPNYPDSDVLGPEDDATRAEAAKYVHEATVASTAAVSTSGVTDGRRAETRSGALPAGAVHTYEYPVQSPSTRAVEVTLSGTDGTDLDLYVTLDGRPPTRTDFDRASRSFGAEETVVLGPDDVDADATLGIAVVARSGGGYELRIVERDG